MSSIYKFRVGVKDIGNPLGKVLGFFGFNHSCLLLNKDLFEYYPKSYERHKDVGRYDSYD